MYVLTALEADIQDQRTRVCLGPAWFSIFWQRDGCSPAVLLSCTWWTHCTCWWVGQERACSLPLDDVLLTVPSCGEKGQKPQYLLYQVTDLIPAPTQDLIWAWAPPTGSPLVHLYLDILGPLTPTETPVLCPAWAWTASLCRNETPSTGNTSI